ncbi:ABC transporter [Dissulfurispira thermophila]|uniref:ABC transporter n=1 Tax=Dissulfurispira thermophila TaxID=2715679 RepID=A0A7G1GYW6_9BACT|nr:ABC transporter permease [Dissulfurispira thermophila]BCB95564.1 ABC transporter [Dissulfurispira thermophila]
MMRRLLSLVQKEFAQILRDKALLFILAWAFTGAIYTAGHGMSMEVKRFPTIIFDMSKGTASRELISRVQMPYFKVLSYIQREEEITEWLDSGRASMAIVIPPDFQRRINGREDAKIQVITDGTISMSATIATAYLAQIASSYSMEIMEKQGRFTRAAFENLPIIDERLRVEFNPNNLSSWFTSLLELLNMFTMVSLLLTAAALVREKEYGTLEQLLVSPARLGEIFISKIIPTIVIVLCLSILSIFLVLKPIFNVPIRGSLLLFYSIAAIYVFTMSSLGIAIATVARNLSQAMMIMLLILAPMLFLSGAWTPPEAMAPWMQWASHISPMRYFIDFGYSVLFKGNGIAYVWKDVAGIIIMGILLFSFSIWWFGKKTAS